MLDVSAGTSVAATPPNRPPGISADVNADVNADVGFKVKDLPQG